MLKTFAKFSSSVVVGVVVSVVIIGGSGNGVVYLFHKGFVIAQKGSVCVCKLFFYRIVFTWMFFSIDIFFLHSNNTSITVCSIAP